jgi:alkyl hydroperoxide reductase subunit AhpC
MRATTRFLSATIVPLLLLAAAAAPVRGQQQAQQPQLAQVEPIDPSRPFPAHTFPNLNPGAGVESVNLGDSIGKKPVVLFYWIAGHPRADEVFQELQQIAADAGGDKLALFGVVFPRTEGDKPVIGRRLTELGIKVPVLEDEGFRIGQQLRVQSVPNVTILDREGLLRLTNGASLAQVVGYKQTVGSAVEKVAAEGTVGNYGYLARYYPAKEMVGKRCPDFKAPLLENSVEQRWSSLHEDGKLNVLIFWSVDCPHCRKSLPEINAWLKANPDGINVVSAASVPNDTVATKTKEYCDVQAFVFPTLVDRDLAISQLFNVTTTPTIVIVGPDGVIDSVMTSSTQDFGRKMEEIKARLLKSESAS